MKIINLKILFTCSAAVSALVSTQAACAQQRNFNLEGDSATRSIPRFAHQAGLQIVAPGEALRGKRTPPINGEFDARVALQTLLRGTGLVVGSDDGIVITLVRAPATHARTPAARSTSRTSSQKDSQTPRQAESDVTEAASQSDEIIVTAQKRSERLSTVPLSITAATGDQLQRQNITSVNDLPKIVPGLTYTKSAYSAPVFTIRGIGSYDEALAISPTVSVYVDQVPLPFSRMTEGAALDVERVEVLKGPQGTLFGQNSTGGAINYIANKPTDTFAAGGDITFGRFAQAEIGGFVSGPITEGVNARLAARVEQRGDWQRSYTRKDSAGARDFGTARLLLDVRPTEDILLEFGAEGWYNKSDTQAKRKIGFSQINPFTPFPDSPGFPTLQADLQAYPDAPSDMRAADWDPGLDLSRNDSYYRLSLRAEADLSPAVKLTSLTSYSRIKVDSPNDADGTALPNGVVFIDSSLRSFTQELRLSGQFGDGDRIKWMLGGNYEYDDSDDKQVYHIRGSNTGVRLPAAAGGTFRYTQSRNLSGQKISTKAAFASLSVDLSSHLTLDGSIRYTKQGRDYAGCAADSGNGELAAAFAARATFLSGSPQTIAPGGCISPDPVTNAPMGFIKLSLNEDNVSWRTSLAWKPSSDFMLYGNVTQGYKAGSFGTLPVLSAVQAAPVTQESVLAYEAGFKAAVLGRALQASGAFFYYDYTNKQLLGSRPVPPFGTLPSLISIPKSRVWGAELDIVARPLTGLTLRIGGTYVNSRVQGNFTVPDPLPALRPAGKNINGDSFPNTPRWQVTSDAEYRFAVSDEWRGFVGSNLAYRSETRSFFGGNDQFVLPGHALLDLRAGFEREDGSLRASIWGRNVTNKSYKTFVSRAFDTVFENRGMPVTYGLTITTRF